VSDLRTLKPKNLKNLKKPKNLKTFYKKTMFFSSHDLSAIDKALSNFVSFL